jgi:transposase
VDTEKGSDVVYTPGLRRTKVSRKRYDTEFKREAVRLVLEQGLTRTQVAKDLGISQPILGRWVKQVESGGADAFPGRGRLIPSEQRVRDLERELKRVTMQRDILKKAITYFSEHEK